MSSPRLDPQYAQLLKKLEALYQEVYGLECPPIDFWQERVESIGIDGKLLRALFDNANHYKSKRLISYALFKKHSSHATAIDLIGTDFEEDGEPEDDDYNFEICTGDHILDLLDALKQCIIHSDIFMDDPSVDAPRRITISKPTFSELQTLVFKLEKEKDEKERRKKSKPTPKRRAAIKDRIDKIAKADDLYDLDEFLKERGY